MADNDLECQLLSKKNEEWYKQFVQEKARRPKILHIGNIANNAYNNAKILEQAGFDSDVICYDYYHMMGTPEWEDSDFLAGGHGDDFNPDWVKANIQDFSRPKWFAQGEQLTAIEYLIARHRGNEVLALSLWQKLGTQNKTAEIKSSDSVKVAVFKSVRNIRERLWWSFRRIMIYIFEPLGLKELLSHFYNKSVRTIWHRLRTIWHRLRWGLPYSTERRIEELVNKFQNEFPDRKDKLRNSDIYAYGRNIKHWKKLFKNYDVIIGYSIDPYYPMLASQTYFAFEHGTLRDIPFQDNFSGRLTALSYRLAQHVFVTNFDCLENANFLAPGRHTMINHPYDENHSDKITGVKELRVQLCSELHSSFLFFHPTRQDWVKGTGYADKKNDEFIRAFIQLRKSGKEVGLICCEWGKNVRQTKALLKENNCENYVKWIPPLPIISYERMCKASDIIVDQFLLGAFGGVLFKALAVGTPILTYLKEELLLEQYLECPPVINCKSTKQICEKMEMLFSDKTKLDTLSQQGKIWMQNHHSKVQPINAQVDQFRQYLAFE